jgi:hypothetical protein
VHDKELRDQISFLQEEAGRVKANPLDIRYNCQIITDAHAQQLVHFLGRQGEQHEIGPNSMKRN